jgi:hypothetical protein
VFVLALLPDSLWLATTWSHSLLRADLLLLVVTLLLLLLLQV